MANANTDQYLANNKQYASGPDAVTVRGFICDVDTGKLEEVSYPGPMGTFG